MGLFERKEKILNWMIDHSPAWIQIIFMERVMKSVKASFLEEAKQAGKVLFSEKEGSLREGRRYRPSNPFRTPRMDVLGLPEANQPLFKIPTLYGRDGRAYYSDFEGWDAHLGQRGTGPRPL